MALKVYLIQVTNKTTWEVFEKKVRANTASKALQDFMSLIYAGYTAQDKKKAMFSVKIEQLTTLGSNTQRS